MKRIQQLLTELTEQRVAFEADRRRSGRGSAPDFSVFGYMAPGELRLSKILADLLDPAGTHGQGTMFVAEFLETLSLDWPTDDLEAARVEVEAGTFERRRVDIVVRFPGAVLGVENKPFAADQPNQVADYLSWLDVTGREGHRCLVYLAGVEGALPTTASVASERLRTRTEEGQFRALSYPALLPWLERARTRCGAERVTAFLDDFCGYIRKQFMGVRDMTEREQIVRIAQQSPENLRSTLQIVAAASDIRAAILEKLEGQIRNALPDRYEITWFDASQARYTGVGIKMPGVVDLWFTVSFEGTGYHWLIYGVSRSKDVLPVSDPKPSLDAEYGTGTVTERWPWYRRAKRSEQIFPVVGDWRVDEEPWLSVNDGSLAGIVVRAAQSFRETLIRP